MTRVKFEDAGGGRLRIVGPLTFMTAAAALADSQRLFAEQAQLDMDLSGVERADSAGLALLVEWVSRARKSRCALRFHSVPEQLRALARISDVDKLLPLAE